MINLRMVSLVLLVICALGGISYCEEAGLISMDFDNVDIRVVIKFMSELTGKNFIIDSSVQAKTTVISPTKVTVEEAYKVLESILIVNGYTTVPSGSVVKVIPLSEAKQRDIETYVGKEMDGDSTKDRVVTQLVPLEYADAGKIKAVLNPYISSTGYIDSYLPSNTLIITDVSSNLSKALEIVRGLDKPASPQADSVHVYHAQNTDSAGLAQILTKVYLEKQQSKEGNAVQPPTIVADTSSNSLVIVASPQEYAFLEQVVKKLDSKKPQVWVEAVIAEVSMEKTLELGLELAAAGGIIYGSSSGFAGAETKGVVRNILTGGGFQDTNALGVVEGTTLINDPSKVTAGVTMPNLGLLITASSNNDDINVLSAPQLLATDNEEAHIMVGKQLAFIKNTQVTAEGGTVRTFEYRDVGLLLKIVPHISEDDFVRMDITQQVEDVIGQTFEGAVETSKREANTVVTVRDNTMVVIGGLLTDKKKNTVEKVPLLGDIPVLNLLFSRKKTSNEKANLFIFITPHIVRDSGTIENVTAEKRDECPVVFLKEKNIEKGKAKSGGVK